MTIMVWLLFAAGLGLLVLGAELLVRGASRLAIALGISPLVVGLTVVAYGTSSPELAVSLKAAAAGQADLAVGNVVGSNIFNVLLILGLASVITPLVIARQLVILDVPIMVGVSVLTLLLALDGRIGRADGAILFALAIIYTIFSIRQGRKDAARDDRVEHAPPDEDPLDGHGRGAPITATAGPEDRVPAAKIRGTGPILLNVAFVLAGLGLLVLGSRWMVGAAIQIARALGVGETIIGLTLVAAGTSMPEVATSVMAAVRGQRDIAAGNVIGSNIFNLMAVLGLSGVLASNGLPVAAPVLALDLPFMVAVALACLPIFFTGHRLDRWEGLLFLAYYAAYTSYLILDAAGHQHLELFGRVMLVFVVPLTILTIGASVAHAMRRRPERPPAS